MGRDVPCIVFFLHRVRHVLLFRVGVFEAQSPLDLKWFELMPHDTVFAAILGMLFYFFVPQYFGYAAIALVLWLGVPIMRVVWQTTKDFREIPDAEDEKDDDGAQDES